jgi:hypothetical protein
VPLGTPDVLVCSVGTEIFFEAGGAAPQPDRKWAAELDKGWDRAAAIRTAESFSQLRVQARRPTESGGGAGLRSWACARL